MRSPECSQNEDMRRITEVSKSKDRGLTDANITGVSVSKDRELTNIKIPGVNLDEQSAGQKSRYKDLVWSTMVCFFIPKVRVSHQRRAMELN